MRNAGNTDDKRLLHLSKVWTAQISHVAHVFAQGDPWDWSHLEKLLLPCQEHGAEVAVPPGLGRMGYLRRRGYYVLSRLVPEFVARFGFMLSGWCQFRTRTRTCIHVRRYLLERVSKPLPFPRTYFLCAGLLARQMPRVPHYLCETCRSPSCHQRDGLHKGAAIMLHAWNDIGTFKIFKLHFAMLHKPLLRAKPIDLSKLGCSDCWFTPCWHHSCIASTFDRAQGRGMSTTSFLARALIRLRRCIKVLTSGKEREWLVPSLFSNYQASSQSCLGTLALKQRHF